MNIIETQTELEEQELKLIPTKELKPLLGKLSHSFQVDVEKDEVKEKSNVKHSSSLCDKLKECVQQQWGSSRSVLFSLGGVLLISGAGWLLSYSLVGDEVAPPKGGLFLLVALVVVAYAAGWLLSLVGLPPLLGMLVVGIAARTGGLFDVSPFYHRIVVVSRDVALSVILIKAGLGLDPVALRKNVATVLALAVCPCVIEAVAAAIAAHFFLHLPWLWAFLLGFLLSPISPAVVVPTLLNLKEKGYGEDKGISTTVIAASSIDDIASISLFSVFFSLTFDSNSNLTALILEGPKQFVVGILAGIFWGFVSSFIPHRNDENVNVKRSFMVGLGGLIAVIGSKKVKFQAAGTLACITAAFVCNVCWKSQQTPQSSKIRVAEVFSTIWLVMQPTLFGLIGTEIDLTKLDMGDVGNGIIVLSICLTLRIMACFLVLLFTQLNWKERLFVNLAWLPKATVQAALGSQALDKLRASMAALPEDLARGELLLTTAVIAILITAPLGSIGITLTGTKLLTRVTNDR